MFNPKLFLNEKIRGSTLRILLRKQDLVSQSESNPYSFCNMLSYTWAGENTANALGCETAEVILVWFISVQFSSGVPRDFCEISMLNDCLPFFFFFFNL